MVRKQYWIILETLLLVIWIITLIIFLIAVFNPETKCKANPLIYGTKYLSNKNNANMTCLCQFDNEPTYDIFIDRYHWELRNNAEEVDPNDVYVWKLNFTGG